MFKKLTTPREHRDESSVPVMVEPRKGITDQELMQKLENSGAEHVKLVAPGFISADAKPSILGGLEKFAYVHVKPAQQMHAF